MHERERKCKLQMLITCCFTTNCVSVCYGRFKGKCLLRNYRISECFSLLKKFLLGCHDGNYIVCQTATTSVGSEFSLRCSQFILCATQRTSVAKFWCIRFFIYMKHGRFMSSKQIKRGDVLAIYIYILFRIGDEANDTTL